MTPRQIELVQSTWIDVAPQSVRAARVFYRWLFELAPSFRALFPPDMKEQEKALMEMLNIVINGLTMFEELRPDFEELGRRHSGYGVEEWQYDRVRDALLRMLGEMLGERFTPEAEGAWGEVYDQLAKVMKSAAYAHV